MLCVLVGLSFLCRMTECIKQRYYTRFSWLWTAHHLFNRLLSLPTCHHVTYGSSPIWKPCNFQSELNSCSASSLGTNFTVILCMHKSFIKMECTDPVFIPILDAESSEWFELEYHQAFGKTMLYHCSLHSVVLCEN